MIHFTKKMMILSGFVVLLGGFFVEASELPRRACRSEGSGFMSSTTCRHCKASFKTNREAVVCERGHASTRPFPCPHCPIICTGSSRLQNHIRTHTGEKPFKCPDCGLMAAQKSNAMNHCKKKRKRAYAVSLLSDAAAPYDSDISKTDDGAVVPFRIVLPIQLPGYGNQTCLSPVTTMVRADSTDSLVDFLPVLMSQYGATDNIPLLPSIGELTGLFD